MNVDDLIASIEAKAKLSVIEREGFTLEEAAVFLGCSLQTLKRQISRGEIAGFRIGTGIRVSRENLLEFVQRQIAKAAKACQRKGVAISTGDAISKEPRNES